MTHVILLDDDPAEVDAFDAKAHEQIATAIAALVAREPGGRVIGLEGEWGSGKSTVVRLTRDHLETPDQAGSLETLVVVFDAWAHQGDKLRRAFLETVIARIELRTWLPRCVAKTYRDRLSGRTSHVNTKSSARLSFEGVCASMAALALLFGAALFQHNFTHPWLWHRLGFLLMLSPFAVVFTFALLHAVGAIAVWRKRKEPWLLALAGIRAFSFFAQVQDTDIETNAIERGEPTSVEFAEIFSDLLQEALVDDRRLLLVLDNLDRVDEGDARTILATMQTFTSSLNSNPLWGSRVWTMIPYDPAGLQRLWNVASTDAEEGDRAFTASTATAFIDKVFQIRFSVPPLILSDWRSHLLRLLRTALPTTNEETLQGILRLRSAYRSASPTGVVSQEKPTPRQLIQFVNQIGSIYRQRQDISLRHIAYFVLLQRDWLPVADQLRDGTLPFPSLAHLVGPSIEMDLAALLFGTTADRGQQFLLTEQLELALDSGDVDRIISLAKRSGFVHALDFIDLSERTKDGAVGLARVIASLDEAEVLVQPEVKEWFEAAVESLIRSTNSWMLAGRQSGAGIALGFSAVASDEASLQETLSRVLPGRAPGDADGHQQMLGIAGLVDGLGKLARLSDNLRLAVDIPADSLVENLAFLSDQVQDQSSLALLEFSDTSAGAASLSASAIAGSPQVLVALDVLLVRPTRVDCPELATEVLTWLSTADPSNAEQVAVLFNVLDRCRMLSVDSMGISADDGTLMNAALVASQLGSWDATASASMLQLSARPTLAEPAVLRQSPQGTQLLREVLTNPATHPELMAAQTDWLAARPTDANALIFEIEKTAEFLPWANAQIKELRGRESLKLSVSQYLEHMQQLRDELSDVEVTRITADFLEDAGSFQELLDSGSAIGMMFALLACALKGRERDAKPFLEAGAKIIEAVTEDSWSSALKAETTNVILGLALRLRRAGQKIGPITALSNVLHDHAKALASGEEVWKTDGDSLRELASCIDVRSRHVLGSEIAAELETLDGTIGPQLFATYGVFLAGESSFRRHTKIPNVVERLVAHDAWTDIGWFAGVAEEHKDMFASKGRIEEIEHLKLMVADKCGELGESCPDELRSLAHVLRIKPVGSGTPTA